MIHCHFIVSVPGLTLLIHPTKFSPDEVPPQPGRLQLHFASGSVGADAWAEDWGHLAMTNIGKPWENHRKTIGKWWFYGI